VPAQSLISYPGVTYVPYKGEPLYNVLLSNHSVMSVEGLECETLDPRNLVAKIVSGVFTVKERNGHLRLFNRAVRSNDYKSYIALEAAVTSRVRQSVEVGV
jgi:hypothetical protein